MTKADALVLFGVTGDLARRRLFPALYDLTAKRSLDIPIVGVASSPWTDEGSASAGTRVPGGLGQEDR